MKVALCNICNKPAILRCILCGAFVCNECLVNNVCKRCAGGTQKKTGMRRR